MADVRSVVRLILRSGKRAAVSVLGLGLLIGGVALLVLPGPGILVMIAGLAVLASEYAWARRALNETKRRANQAKDKILKRGPNGRRPS